MTSRLPSIPLTNAASAAPSTIPTNSGKYTEKYTEKYTWFAPTEAVNKFINGDSNWDQLSLTQKVFNLAFLIIIPLNILLIPFIIAYNHYCAADSVQAPPLSQKSITVETKPTIPPLNAEKKPFVPSLLERRVGQLDLYDETSSDEEIDTTLSIDEQIDALLEEMDAVATKDLKPDQEEAPAIKKEPSRQARKNALKAAITYGTVESNVRGVMANKIVRIAIMAASMDFALGAGEHSLGALGELIHGHEMVEHGLEMVAGVEEAVFAGASGATQHHTDKDFLDFIFEHPKVMTALFCFGAGLVAAPMIVSDPTGLAVIAGVKGAFVGAKLVMFMHHLKTILKNSEIELLDHYICQKSEMKAVIDHLIIAINTNMISIANLNKFSEISVGNEDQLEANDNLIKRTMEDTATIRENVRTLIRAVDIQRKRSPEKTEFMKDIEYSIMREIEEMPMENPERAPLVEDLRIVREALEIQKREGMDGVANTAKIYVKKGMEAMADHFREAAKTIKRLVRRQENEPAPAAIEPVPNAVEPAPTDVEPLPAV